MDEKGLTPEQTLAPHAKARASEFWILNRLRFQSHRDSATSGDMSELGSSPSTPTRGTHPIPRPGHQIQVLFWEGVISSTGTWWDKHVVQWEGRSGPRSPNVCSRLCEPNGVVTPLATLLCFSIFKINCREKTKEEAAQRGQRGRHRAEVRSGRATPPSLCLDAQNTWEGKRPLNKGCDARARNIPGG